MENEKRRHVRECGRLAARKRRTQKPDEFRKYQQEWKASQPLEKRRLTYQKHKNYARNWCKENKEYLREYFRNYMRKYYWKNREKLREYNRKRLRANPRSTSHSGIINLIMAKVRLRDNNTCQWYGCDKRPPESRIHVHHIFPAAEYPQYKTIERYMICYCDYHHWSFHEARGDISARILKPKFKEIQYTSSR